MLIGTRGVTIHSSPSQEKYYWIIVSIILCNLVTAYETIWITTKVTSGNLCVGPCFVQTDYYYQYTECDNTGSRWRVAIPLNPGSCSDLPPPTRGTDCCKHRLCVLTSECTLCLSLRPPHFSPSLLLSGWDVFRDEHPAVHALPGWLVLAWQRPPFWPMGCHPCRLHQSGQLLGPWSKRRGHAGL